MPVDEEMEERRRTVSAMAMATATATVRSAHGHAVRPPRAAPSDTQAASWRTRRHAGGAREMHLSMATCNL